MSGAGLCAGRDGCQGTEHTDLSRKTAYGGEKPNVRDETEMCARVLRAASLESMKSTVLRVLV